MDRMLGDALKKERESRGLTLEKLAVETHLQRQYLEALENEDLQVLPSELYVKYYIKAYLRALGVDEANFFGKYQGHLSSLFRRFPQVSIEQCLENVHYAKFRKGRFLLAVFFALALSGLVLLVEPWRWIPAQKHAAAIIEATRLTLPANLPADGFLPDFDAVSVSISVRDHCWISADRGREKILEKVCQKGEVLNLDGYRLTVTIGNPGAVAMKINGRELAGLRQQKEPIKLVLTPASLGEIFKRY